VKVRIRPESIEVTLDGAHEVAQLAELAARIAGDLPPALDK
jgi:hypothetical protein